LPGKIGATSAPHPPLPRERIKMRGALSDL
jgi:hypothetical protein